MMDLIRQRHYCSGKYWLMVALVSVTTSMHAVPDRDKTKEGHACSFDLKLSRDTAICRGAAVVLTASGADGYSWSTGATTASITVYPDESTEYWVMASKETCVDFGIVRVNVFPAPEAEIDGVTSMCSGDSVILSASGGDVYLWNTGSVNPSILVAPEHTSTYQVIVSNQFCSDTARIDIMVKPRLSFITGNNSICIGERDLIYTLAPLDGIGWYEWKVPEGWSISSGQGGATIAVTPGITPGKGQITVTADHDQCFTAVFQVVSGVCPDHAINLVNTNENDTN